MPIVLYINKSRIGSGWSGSTSGYSISGNKLDVGNGGDIYWNANAFGPSQEAYIKFSTVASSGEEQDLILKSQCSNTYSCGILEVWYDAPNQKVMVVTYTSSQGWVQRGADIAVTFANGDGFGARATANGQVSVYKNGVLLGTRDVSAWPYYDDGGYIGVWFLNASAAVGDDFGGGTMPGSSLVGPHVKASLVKAAHGEKAYRKAQSLLQAPPTGQVWRSYYFQGAARLALRVQVNGVEDKVYYLLTDHLGSTAITVNVNGSKEAEIRYKPWGETRYTDGITPTDYLYTGQREETGIGLYFYQSRFYDAYLNRWTQPDSIIPKPGNVQDWDRYAYARNNPVRYTDPDGHRPDDGCREDGYSGDPNVIKHIKLKSFYGGPSFEYPNPYIHNDPGPGTKGNPFDLFIRFVDIAGYFLGSLGQEPKDNVFVFLSYYEYQDGSVSIPEISIKNKSNGNIYLSSVVFSNERYDNSLPGSSYFCTECGTFISRSNNEDPYLGTVRGNDNRTIQLPSTEPHANFSPYPAFSGKVNIDVTVKMIVPALKVTYANETFFIPANIWRSDFFIKH